MTKIEALISKAHTEWLDKGNGLIAEKLFLEAAELGSPRAFHELGTLYGTGCRDLKPNPEQARFFLEKSLESGFEATIASNPE